MKKLIDDKIKTQTEKKYAESKQKLKNAIKKQIDEFELYVRVHKEYLEDVR